MLLVEMLRANRRIRLILARTHHYRTLEIERGATMEEIKKAHKAMARKYHPDRPGGDQNKFVAAQEAFEVLSNDEQRAAYDREIFGKAREEPQSSGEETAEDMFYRNARGVWKREEGEEHVSEKYQAGLHQFDRMERKFYRRIDAAKAYLWDKVNNPAKTIFVLVSCCVALYYIDKAFRMYTEWLCSGAPSVVSRLSVHVVFGFRLHI